MDEDIRIYGESKALIPYPETGMTNVEKKKKSEPLKGLIKVIEEDAERTRKLREKHPFASIFYNWIALAACLALVVSLVVYGIQVNTQNKIASMTAIAMADYQAEQEAEKKAQEEARLAALKAEQKSEEYIVKTLATKVAKMFYGIRNFEEKYGYSELDFETYARCAFNRAEAIGGPDGLAAVIDRKDQWVGYSDGNQVVDKYYRMARGFVEEWIHEETKPCSTEYTYAELTEHGIYLKKSLEADAYSPRWRASN